MRWETETEFDGKLCQEYSRQKLSKSDIGFQVTVENVGDVFLGHSVVDFIKYFTKSIQYIINRFTQMNSSRISFAQF